MPQLPFKLPYQWLPYVASVSAILILLSQAYHPSFRPHLQADILTFQKRASYFIDHQTWSGLGQNEHQPGTLWLFVGLGHLAANVHDLDAYITATVLCNTMLLLMLFTFYHYYGHRLSLPLFALLLVASGPILLYRFEAIVGILTVIAWQLFRRQKTLSAAALLGLATSVKIYPIILLPLLLAESLRTKNVHRAFQTAGAYLLGLALPIVTLLAAGSTLPEMKTALDFHSDKPVTTESLVGQTVMLGQKLTGIPVRPLGKNNIYGFTSDIPYISDNLLNYAWIPPLLIFYGFLWHRYRHQGFTDPLLAFVTLLLFILFTKVLNPQYLWWPLFFLPLISISKVRQSSWLLLIFYSLSILILTTIVFPLNYSLFLSWLRGQTQNPNFFIILVVRNIFLLILTVSVLQTIFQKKPSHASHSAT